MIFPIEKRAFIGKDTHAYWEDFLTDAEINYILALPNWMDVEAGKVGGSGGGDIAPEIRRSNVSWFYPNQQNKFIWDKIADAFAQVNRQFFNFDLTGLYEPAQLGVYTAKEKGHYTWHTDGIKDHRVPRKLSMALLLDDPATFEGGELMIKAISDEPVSLEQKRGRAWFFPSYTLHTVTPVTRGTRRSLVIWAGGPEFK